MCNSIFNHSYHFIMRKFSIANIEVPSKTFLGVFFYPLLETFHISF